MSGTSGSLMLVFVVIVALALFGLYLFATRARQVNESKFNSPDQEPELAQYTAAPTGVIPKKRADFMQDTQSEKLAAPFSEQIEDIVHDLINADPELAGTVLDFGTAPDGTLEIWVNDKRYAEVGHLPDERLQAVIQQAIKIFNEQYTKS